MRRNRVLLAGLIAMTCVLAPASESWAGPQKDAVCQGSCGGGCGPCPGEGGSSYSGGGSYPAWGGATENCMAKAKQCRTISCAISQIVIGLPISLLMDAPYYAGKGVGYGLYYGGKGLGYGLYYGGKGLGKGFYYGAVGIGTGTAYVGRSIGRAVAAPFKKRPPKPVVIPAPAKLGARKPHSRFDEPESIDTAPIILDDRSELRKKFDDDYLPLAKRIAEGASLADTHREGVAMTAELAGGAKIANEKLGRAFQGVAVVDAAVTAYEGNVAGAGGKLVSLGIGMIASGPAYAGQVISVTAKNAMLRVSAGIYEVQGMTSDEAAEMAAKDYDRAHKDEKSAETRFWWGVTGL